MHNSQIGAGILLLFILAQMASLLINPLMASHQGKNVFWWFLLSFPLGIAGTVYLFLANRRINQGNARNHAWEVRLRELNAAEEEEKDRQASIASFSNSRFNRRPTDFREWERTEGDLSTLVRLINCVVEGRRDSLEAPLFPAKSKEVVFLEKYGSLTNHAGTSFDGFGKVYLTNFRVLFVGEQKTVEWSFNKMISFGALDLKHAAVFKCTDQPVVKGVQLNEDDWFRFQCFLNVAFDTAKRSIAEVAKEISSKLHDYQQQRPPLRA